MNPGLTVEPVGGTMDCRGMGGRPGFKKDHYDVSVRLDEPLIRKIQAANPDAAIAGCLSCRKQFQHLPPCPVYHPAEIPPRVCGGREAVKGEEQE